MKHTIIPVTPELRIGVDKAIDMERKKAIAMGFDPDSPEDPCTKEMLPLQERLKSDEVDLSDQEVSLLRYLLSEYQGYLEGRLDIPLVPASYTKKVRESLAFVSNFLETLN